MDPKRIEGLLDNYFEGKSSLEEETTLRQYFNQEEVSEHLRIYQPLFRFFEEEQALELGTDFDERLLSRLEQPNAQKVRQLWPMLARIAAVVLLAIGTWWIFPRPEALPQQASIDWSKYEPETPEEAYRVTRMALLKLSGKLSDGAETAVDEMDKVKEIGRFIK